jgi:hypothetical protein
MTGMPTMTLSNLPDTTVTLSVDELVEYQNKREGNRPVYEIVFPPPDGCTFRVRTYEELLEFFRLSRANIERSRKLDRKRESDDRARQVDDRARWRGSEVQDTGLSSNGGNGNSEESQDPKNVGVESVAPPGIGFAIGIDRVVLPQDPQSPEE